MEPVWYPVFPLRVACFPGHRIPLRIFEERYQRLLQDLADRPQFVVALISHGEEVGGPATPFRVGTLVRFDAIETQGDSLCIKPVGLRRLYLESFDREQRPYLMAECRSYSDEQSAPATSRLRELEARLLSAAAVDAGGVERLENLLATARERCDAENYSLFLCGCLHLPPIYAQRLLESRSAERRLLDTLQLLRDAET